MVKVHEVRNKGMKALKLLSLLMLIIGLNQSCGSLEKCNCPGGKKSLISFE